MQIQGLTATASHSIEKGSIRKGTDKRARRGRGRGRKRIRNGTNVWNEDEEKGERGRARKSKNLKTVKNW
jgi:hypothetical protein